MTHQFNSHYAPSTYYLVEKEVRPYLLAKEIFRLLRFVRQRAPVTLNGEALPKKKDELEGLLSAIFAKDNFKLHYECERVAYREIGRSTDERTLIATLLPVGVFLNNKLPYVTPLGYDLSASGKLTQLETDRDGALALLCLLNSFVLNYYIRSKVSATVNMFYVYELPIPPLDAKQKKQLASAAAKLSNRPDDLSERERLEVFIARDLYGLSLDDWRHLCGSFIYGGESDSKADLDEIIRLATADWN